MDPDRTTPTIRLRVKLPGKQAPERIAALRDLPGFASRVVKMSFEDNEKMVDKAKIQIANYDLRFPDDPTFDRGNTLYLQWGYQGNMSLERELVIVDWTPGTDFMVEAHAQGDLMNRYPVDETYYGLTYAQIAVKIAERNGFGPDVRFIEPSPVVLESEVQHHLTDAQYLRKLAKQLGYVFYVDVSGLHFHPRDLGQKPRKTLRYFPNERAELLAFPAFEKAPANSTGAVTLKGTDAVTGKPFTVRGDDTSTKGRPGLATTLEVIDKKTATTALREKAGKEAIAHTSAPNEAVAKAHAAGLYKKASVPVKCTARCHGDPQFQAKGVVTIENIGTRLSGAYYCTAATHQIEAGRYEMTLKLVRDGTNGAGGAAGTPPNSKADVNKQKGPAGGAAPPLSAVEKIDPATGQTKVTYRR